MPNNTGKLLKLHLSDDCILCIFNLIVNYDNFTGNYRKRWRMATFSQDPGSNPVSCSRLGSRVEALEGVHGKQYYRAPG